MSDIKIISGRSHIKLARKISTHLKKPLTTVNIKNFADGEIYVQVQNTVRGDDVFVIQSIVKPVNESLMELLILIDALKRASAKSITVVCPYLAYSRQDRKVAAREPITAKLVSNLLTTAGVSRVVTVDFHATQIQGFYDIPVDHINGYNFFAQYLKSYSKEDCVIVSPDIGGVKRANKLADLLGLPIAIIDKVRSKHNHAEVSHLVGEVKNKIAILFDDMIDTGGSITAAAEEIKKRGAKDILICASHGLLSGDAINRINKSPVSRVILLDTLPIEPKIKNIETISTAPLLAKVIKRIYKNKSLGELLNENKSIYVSSKVKTKAF